MKKILLILSAPFVLASCTTYHISTQSLLEQFARVKKADKITNFIMPPYVYFPAIVEGNNLKKIKVLDKHEQEHTLPVTNHTGVKITRKDGRETQFYFNTLLLKDSAITGSKTHFFEARIKPINLNDIARIEIEK